MVSRRGFLRGSLAGGAVLAASPALMVPNQPIRARALRMAAVYGEPGGALVGHYAEDSLHTVRQVGAFFVTEHGFVTAADLIPLQALSATPTLTRLDHHATADLVAPVAWLRSYADPFAPSLLKLGQGARFTVVGGLSDRFGEYWYEVAPSGWVPAAQVAIREVSETREDAIRVRLDESLGSVQVWVGGQWVLESPFALARTETEESRYAPVLYTDTALSLRGVWWHNSFGSAQPTMGVSSDVIDLPMAALRALERVIGANRSRDVL